jgi:hypothetical protein
VKRTNLAAAHEPGDVSAAVIQKKSFFKKRIDEKKEKGT